MNGMHFFFPDIYICVVSFAHNVAAKDYYIAIVNTTVETSDPEAELKPGLDLLGDVIDKYVPISCTVSCGRHGGLKGPCHDILSHFFHGLNYG